MYGPIAARARVSPSCAVGGSADTGSRHPLALDYSPMCGVYAVVALEEKG